MAIRRQHQQTAQVSSWCILFSVILKNPGCPNLTGFIQICTHLNLISLSLTNRLAKKQNTSSILQTHLLSNGFKSKTLYAVQLKKLSLYPVMQSVTS